MTQEWRDKVWNNTTKKFVVEYKDGVVSEPMTYWESQEEWATGFASRVYIHPDFCEYKAP